MISLIEVATFYKCFLMFVSGQTGYGQSGYGQQGNLLFTAQ